MDACLLLRADTCEITRFDREQAGKPIGLAGAQTEQQTSSLKVRAAHVVGDREAEPGMPARVEPREVTLGDLALVAHVELVAAQREPRPVRDDAEQSALR